MARKTTSYVRTMAFRQWLTLLLFCIAALAIVGVSQMLLLDDLTNQTRISEVKGEGTTILANYGRDPEQMEQIAFVHGWRIMTLDADGNVLERYDGFDIACRGKAPHELGELSDFTLRVIDKLTAELDADAESVHSVEHNDADSAIVVYMARLPSQAAPARYLYISSVLLTTEPVLSVLEYQFLIVAAAVLIGAAIIAFGLSRRMSKPIVGLTKGAQRLAHGEFSTEFHGRGFTETEQLATTLNYAAQELRTLDSDRKELLANVSHDLKTPLTIIKIYAETIRDVTGGDAAKRQAHCETIIEEANRLTDMVNEIVEISRLESGASTVVMTEVDLAACLQETLTSFAILAESEGYTFDVEATGEAVILGNEHYMRRALYNLIGNAINYTGEDRYIGIRLSRADGHVRFEVADHGPGISTDKIATIWDRYYKSRSSHKRAVIGSGIGLSIVRHILTLHHATFGVTSAPGLGSRFWFEINEYKPEPETEA
jgi:signal transduction histidine kinase